MPQILRLRGPRAVSEFRLAKLLASLQKLDPGVGSVAAGFWHFVEVEGALGEREAKVLERLLEYGPAPQPADATLFLVVPRLGTVSPWSSKATDIARNCGLARVRRIERGTAYYVDSSRPEIAALRGRRTSALNAGDSAVISIHIGGSAGLRDPNRVCT